MHLETQCSYLYWKIHVCVMNIKHGYKSFDDISSWGSFHLPTNKYRDIVYFLYSLIKLMFYGIKIKIQISPFCLSRGNSWRNSLQIFMIPRTLKTLLWHLMLEFIMSANNKLPTSLNIVLKLSALQV